MQANIFIILIFLGVLSAVSCLVCYSCNSNKVPGCGIDFDIPKDRHSNYLVDCSREMSNAIACRKSVVNEYGQQLVIRSCFNDTSAHPSIPTECREISNAVFCYCLSTVDPDTGKELPCNGQQRQQYNSYLSLGVLLGSLVYLR